MARLGAAQLDRMVQQTEELELGAMDAPAFMDALRGHRQPEAEAYLRNLLKSHTDVHRHAVLLDPAGLVWFSVPPVEGLTGHALVEPVGSGGQVTRWPQVTVAAAREDALPLRMIGVTVPLLDGEQGLGFLQVQFHTEQLEAWMSRFHSGEAGGFLYVVDDRNRIVVHPYQVLAGASASIASWLPSGQAALQASQVRRFRDEAGRWNLAAIQRTSFGWRVVAQQTFKQMQAQARRTYFPVMVLSSFLVVLAVLIGLRRGRRLAEAAPPAAPA